MRTRISVCLAILLLAVSHSASASQILASLTTGSTGGGGGVTSQPAPSAAGIALYFDNSACIGCSPYLTMGSMRGENFEFNRDNTPGFDAFAARLTDAKDELLWGGWNTFDSAGAMGGGGAGGNLESGWFSTPLESPGMVTQVDFILLHIRTFDFSTVNGEDYRINFSGWWDIFGTPGPAFDGPYARPDVAVPEPGSLPLMLLGLIAFAYRAWRRSHRPLESFRP